MNISTPPKLQHFLKFQLSLFLCKTETSEFLTNLNSLFLLHTPFTINSRIVYLLTSHCTHNVFVKKICDFNVKLFIYLGQLALSINLSTLIHSIKRKSYKYQSKLTFHLFIFFKENCTCFMSKIILKDKCYLSKPFD